MSFSKVLTVQQQNAMKELKSRVEDDETFPAIKDDNGLFYKYLKAQDFNIDKAEKMLRKHIVWRKVNQVDKIVDTFKPKEFFVKYFEPSFIGLDKDGSIVMFLQNGRLNAKKVCKCIKINDLMKHIIWFIEKISSKMVSEKSEKSALASLILDLDGLDFANVSSKECTDFYLRLCYLLKDHYSQRIKAVYLINAPSYYTIIYRIIKAIMPVVMRKVHVFGHSGWKESLLEIIDSDILPAFLGGNRTDPDGDPYCKSFIKLYEEIPETYYLSDEERYFKNAKEVTNLKLHPSEKKEISLCVKEAGSIIQWKFLVRNRTIHFGLFFQGSSDLKEIIPMYEYDTPDGTEEGSYKCFSKGKYIIVFDNSNSKFTTKEVQYVITVKEPEN